LIVFLALPYLQKSQRDNQRKQDLSQIVSAIETWRSNNKGLSLDTPAALANLETTYLNNKYDPSTGNNYSFTMLQVTDPLVATPPPTGTVDYHIGHTCNNSGGAPYTQNSAARNFAVLLTLEIGGVFCLDSE
jgi:hypothetical protein